MGIPNPREMAKIRRIRAVALGIMLSVFLGQIFLIDDVHYIYDRLVEKRMPVKPWDKALNGFLMFMDLYEDGIYQTSFLDEICQQEYVPCCLIRGLIALEHGEPGNAPDENRKLAEKFFRQGCAKSDLPVCRTIAETRKDDAFRDPQDEEKVIIGILTMSCEIGAIKACGDAAQRFFEAGDFQMARGYGTRGCAMKDWYGKPFMDPRSCQYRKLALEKLAEAPTGTAAPEEQAALQDIGAE